MTVIERSALLSHPAEQIFDLVAEIERYPEFLDGCIGAEVLERHDNTVTASLWLSKAGISHGFTTCNRLQRPQSMTLTLVEGPFERFQGEWIFRPLGESACKASLRLEFDLARGLAGVAVGKLFDRVAVDLVDAIVRRASQQLGQSA
ncbi:type II toxin-antitoxin system RatA family toxin [Luminiphilus sp.]|nr:type II toxin-antitoxin system RatA family toxin [Luminiphilus sp.]MDA9710946.1 type II toxin-antitoxin system RatA family toxin [Luminiphilus sp.]